MAAPTTNRISNQEGAIATPQPGPTRRLALVLGLAAVAAPPATLRASLAGILPAGLDPARLGAELHRPATITLATCLHRAGLPAFDHATLAARIAEDFATGRVLTVAGWQLSHTEAWLCAAIHAQAS